METSNEKKSTKPPFDTMVTEIVNLNIDESQTIDLIDLSIDGNGHANNMGLVSTKEMIYATPLRKSDRPTAKSSKADASRTNQKCVDGNTVAMEDRHILNFLKDTTKLQQKLQRGGASIGSSGGGENSSGDSEYGKSNFSSLVQEQHFVNLVQQNVIGYGSGGDERKPSKTKCDDSRKDVRLGLDGYNGEALALSPRVAEVCIKREWVIKLIALCLEQRFSKHSAKLSMMPGEAAAVSEMHKKPTPLGRSSHSKHVSQYTGVMVLGSNGSGKTSICQSIMNGNSGTLGMLNRKLLCCYFLSTQNADSHTLSNFIRTIILQILSHSTHFTSSGGSKIDLNQSKASSDEANASASDAGSSAASQNTTLVDTTVLEVKDKTKQNAESNNAHEKKPIVRQKSEMQEVEVNANRESIYDTYPPSQQKSANDAGDDAAVYKSSTPSKIKTTRVFSKIPVKISGSKQVTGTPNGPTPTDPDERSIKKESVTDGAAPNDEKAVAKTIEYENIEMHRKPTKETPPVDSEQQTQPEPPPKSKSCLQTIADEYYAILTQNPDILDNLNAESIEKNPDECFKKAILFPFLELQPPKSALLFIVDSIDEHYLNAEENVMTTLKGHASNRSRSIAELLANNFHLMPKWVFLVCTAKRQNRHIVKKFTGFRKIALDDLRKSHVVKDVQEYIIARLNSDFKGLIQFTGDIIECLNQLYIKSNGSILYVEKVLSGILESVFSFREIKLIPCTLNGLYLYICQRSFNKKQYSKVRPILNVLLACSDFVDTQFVLNCLRTQNYTIDRVEFDKRIAAMNYVLTYNDDRSKIKIFHNSFSDWLSDVKFSTKKFLCNVNEGHAMIAMYFTIVSDTLCPNQVLKYFGYLIKCEEFAFTKSINLDLILILLESRANLDCFYTNSFNCCSVCEVDYKTLHGAMPKLRQAINRYLNRQLNDDVVEFLGDFFKPSLPTNTKVLKLLIETGINNADCQLSYDSLLNSPAIEENNDALAELLIKSEKSCQKNNSKALQAEKNYGNEYEEIASPPSSPSNMASKMVGGTAGDLLDHHQLLARGKALIHLLANEGSVTLLQRALNACKKNESGVATIDLEIEDECGQTALNIAARNGHYDIVELLLDLRYATASNEVKSVNVNHADRDGWTPLRSASWGGHFEVVKLLIRHPRIQIDLADKEQRTALRAAAWSGHEDILRALIAAGADVNSVDKQGRTSLIAASYMGHYDIVEILLENGADVNHLDIDGRSALCVAALCGSSGYSKVMSILLEYHANTDQQDNDGMSPLLVSSFEGNTEVCELLLENGADPDLSDNMSRTPLWAGCTTGYCEIVKLLLFWGCSIDCMDTEGRTVLSIAAAQGNPETVRQLLDRGLDETHRDNAGWSALHYAAFEGYDDICIQLIEAGAKIHECDNEGKNALHIAAQEGRANVIEALVSATSVSIDQKAHDGKTAFRLACMEGNVECVNLLIKYGCDVNLKDADGRPTLYILALENNAMIAKHLLERSNIDVNLPDNEGRTPLHVAAWQGHIEMVKLLIVQGCADVNAMDLDFRTPLHSCAWQGNDKVMEMLLFYGASCDHACKQGATALGISAQEGHEKCVAILLQYEANPHKSDHCGRTPIKLAMKSNNLNVLRLLENSLKSNISSSIQSIPSRLSPQIDDIGPKIKQQQRNAGHKLLQSPPERKIPNGTVFYENTMRSGEVSSIAQHNRKSVISSQSVGSSNNETTVASSSNSKNYQASSHSSSKPSHRFQHNHYRSSVSSHSDIFMKADDHKINFDLSDVGCMSPLYATPPISPSSDTNGPNFDEQLKTSSAIFNEHFTRDTHMRIILGTNKASVKQKKRFA